MVLLEREQHVSDHPRRNLSSLPPIMPPVVDQPSSEPRALAKPSLFARLCCWTRDIRPPVTRMEGQHNNPAPELFEATRVLRNLVLAVWYCSILAVSGWLVGPIIGALGEHPELGNAVKSYLSRQIEAWELSQLSDDSAPVDDTPQSKRTGI